MEMTITRGDKMPEIVGSAKTFTGTVRMRQMFTALPPATVSGALVTFEPGARSFWHTHPRGQVLLVTDGVGWTQCEGGPVKEIRAGDVICCPCQRRHWHGATTTTAMSHFAIQEMEGGRYADWMEEVTDAQYLEGLNAEKD